MKSKVLDYEPFVKQNKSGIQNQNSKTCRLALLRKSLTVLDIEQHLTNWGHIDIW